MKLDRHYTDPRLVALYDRDNPRGADTDFYLRLAADLGARRILDLGCGTGLLTRELAVDGREVTGVDPASAMLAYARTQPGAVQVRWVEGDSGALGTPDADLVVMTGNVAQVFLEEGEWAETLRHIHAALRPGGVLAFESRNPEAREWEGWHREATYEQVAAPQGPLACWVEVLEVGNGRVHFRGHHVFAATGEDVVVDSTLRFRGEAELRASLEHAGFHVEHVYGGWTGEPLTPTSRLVVCVAQR